MGRIISASKNTVQILYDPEFHMFSEVFQLTENDSVFKTNNYQKLGAIQSCKAGPQKGPNAAKYNAP